MLLRAQEKILRRSTNITSAPQRASRAGREAEGQKEAILKEQVRYIDKAFLLLRLA